MSVARDTFARRGESRGTDKMAKAALRKWRRSRRRQEGVRKAVAKKAVRKAVVKKAVRKAVVKKAVRRAVVKKASARRL